jgi:hypothetical protein
MDKSKGTFKSYTEHDGLPDNIINGIVEDNDSTLWISTNKGISRFDKRTGKFSNYNENDGLKVKQFLYGSYLKDSDGTIYFGGQGGVVIIEPDNFRKNTFKPLVYLTDFQLSYNSVEIGKKGSPLKQHISFTDKIILNHRQNMITFNYVALNYMSPKKNQYQYMMDGFDTEWKHVGSRREATYTNLSPGTYTFRVRALNNDVVLNEEGTSVEIIITPHWWKRWWFRILVFIIIIYAVYSVIKKREQATKRDKMILEQKIAEGAKEVQKQKDEIAAQQKALKEKEEAETESKWYNENLAKLSGIISQNNEDLYKMSQALITNISEAVEANLGAIYSLHESENVESYFELIGSFGLSKHTLKNKFDIHEGYIGAVYNDKKIIEIDNLPENYALMKSGLGEVSMKYLILIPLLQDQNLKGVIELASLSKLKKIKIDLVEQLAANMASAIEILSGNERMKHLVEELNTHTEELNAQKEEMQQNMEEMLATQEEIERIRKEEKAKEEKLIKQNAILKEKEAELKMLKKELDNLKKK